MGLPQTLLEVLEARVRSQPAKIAFEFLTDSVGAASTLTYASLEEQAKILAIRIRSVAKEGDRVLIFQPPGFDYIISFWGCLYAGVVAVPVFPPRFNQKLERIQAIVEDVDAQVALVKAQAHTSLQEVMSQYPRLARLHWLATDESTPAKLNDWRAPSTQGASTLAFLQFTSGSTSQPKGVMLSHGNLLANLKAIYEKFGHSEKSQGVIWLPPYHDMGLIGGILQPIYGNFPCTLMSPYGFLQRPIRWLQAISKYRATTSGGPNFAYELCTRRISPEQVKELDLSSWKVAFCGAEPIRKDALLKFAEHFAPAGFDSKAFYPCFGLAEATLMVSGGQVGQQLALGTFDIAAMERNEVREVAEPKGTTTSQSSRTWVGCGDAPDGHETAIVNPTTLRRCSASEVGEIWFQGPSVAQGYWHRPEDSQATFHAQIQGEEACGDWLRTGDLGFLRENQLYVTGRMKDLLIFRGRNIYPMDIEATVGASHTALKSGGTAAFSIDKGGQEQLVVIQELDRTASKGADLEEVLESIRTQIFADHELHAHSIVLIRDNTIPTTSSGKIRRQESRRFYLEGKLTEIHRYVADAH
jgi:acyl-CoA synthetase (AMP-forming)/AMP-acid ligase II